MIVPFTAILFLVMFPYLMSQKKINQDRGVIPYIPAEKTMGYPKIQYILDCSEKRVCMRNCPNSGWENNTSLRHSRKECYRECNKIICLKPIEREIQY
jgi:hypothetical protein